MLMRIAHMRGIIIHKGNWNRKVEHRPADRDSIWQHSGAIDQ